MTRLLVLGAMALTVLFMSCGGPDKKVEGQVDPAPVVADSLRERPLLSIEKNQWRLLTYTQNGQEQAMMGGDSVSVTIRFLYDQATGNTGCNDFVVSCLVDSLGTVQFGDSLAHSSRICTNLMTQERLLQSLLVSMKSYALSSDHRRLELSSDAAKMLFLGMN